MGRTADSQQSADDPSVLLESPYPAETETEIQEDKEPEISLHEREGVSQMSSQALTMSRQQLYDEIWELSASGVAKKYDIPYSQFMHQVKLADIPVPPSGYWTKVSFGKPVEKIPLSGAPAEILTLVADTPRRRRGKPGRTTESPVEISSSSGEETKRPAVPHGQSMPEIPEAVETMDRYGQTYNVYDRETLYREVWQSPVIDVATRYKVSDTTIRKICKALEIPLPKQGYWAKLRAGKPVEKRPPLPETNKRKKRIGPQTGHTYRPKPKETRGRLDFLDEEDRIVVTTVAAQIRIPDENERMHPKIVAHRKVVAAWRKEHKNDSDTGYRSRYAAEPPFLAVGISESSVPRICHILDALAKAVEPLGGKLKDNLTFVINGETIKLSFYEAKDKVEHTLTKEENRQLLEYQEQRKRYKYANPPQIPKYDHPYSGRLTLDISQGKSFRDGSVPLEERLGDILIEMYIAAENTKQDRLRREEAERQRQEEKRKREERRKRHDLEVDKTLALKHEAEDYDIACKIRQYISAYVSAHPDEDLSEWVEWATAKADWYDPTVSREDEFLGVRDHTKEADEREPKRYSWY